MKKDKNNTLVWSKKSIGSIAKFHLAGEFCQVM